MIDCQTKPRANNEYESADLDLISRIGIALTSRQHIAWRVIRVLADQGVVTLQGVVPSYYDRQIIVAVTQHVAGVRRVDDESTIEPPSGRTRDTAVTDAESTAHGGSELRPETRRLTHQQVLQQLPLVSPSLEEILAERANGSAAG